MLDEDALQLVVVERLLAELDELVADVCQHCRLAVDRLVLANFRNDAALDVAEQTSISQAWFELTRSTGSLGPFLGKGSV